ncbi:MAG: tetratricopeptide repeat protein [Gemmatimonadota bacterium]|nr:tetratricopeptide repeat protein [Gemmatimonadota bacterium]
MRRFGSIARSVFVISAATALGAWQQPSRDTRAHVRALADSGKLDDAERVARAGGAALTESLGEVLVIRGRLSQADSVLKVAAQGDVAGRRSAEAALAELAYRRGDRVDALRRASGLAAEFERGGRFTADDYVALGRANVLLGTRDAAAVRQALSAFDKAVAIDSSNIEARLRAGDLLLEKYNAPDAKQSFEDVLKRSPEHPRALLGLARVAVFEGKGDPQLLLRRSLAANASLADAQVLAARFHLEAEQYDSAMIDARRALAVDSSSLEAWSMIGAASRMTGDSAQYNRALAAAQALNSKPADFYAELADAFVRQRRYDEAMRLARVALAVDSTSARVLGLLGNNELHAGHIEEGRALLERAFAIDPFNLWHKNTLDMLDKLRAFKTIDRGHFRFVAPAKEAELLTTYLSPLLEEAFDSLSKHYGYKPAGLVRLEIYPRHADFSVRTMGISGLGALGVSFGPVLMMDAPSAREVGEFNWGSVAWHELAHTFTLGLSNNRTPRWLSEGLSMLEERRARPSWGGGVTLEFLSAYAGGRLRPVSQLNDGFVRPRFESEVILSYYDASLVCEMIAEKKGAAALVNMLTAYRDGLSTPQVFSKVLGSTPEQFDKEFDSWVRTKLAIPLAAVAAGDGKKEPTGPFVAAMRSGVALLEQGKRDLARAALERAEELFPDYSGNGSPAFFLAQLARDRGDLREALARVQRVTSRSETAVDANLLEADLHEKLGDSLGARAPLERLIWMTPYDIPLHVRLAKIAARTGDHVAELRERRAVLALDPPDPLDARYELARALANAGDIPGARRELLAVLEQAPAFEKAQTLLLELRNRTASPSAP